MANDADPPRSFLLLRAPLKYVLGARGVQRWHYLGQSPRHRFARWVARCARTPKIEMALFLAQRVVATLRRAPPQWELDASAEGGHSRELQPPASFHNTPRKALGHSDSGRGASEPQTPASARHGSRKFTCATPRFASAEAAAAAGGGGNAPASFGAAAATPRGDRAVPLLTLPPSASGGGGGSGYVNPAFSPGAPPSPLPSKALFPPPPNDFLSPGWRGGGDFLSPRGWGARESTGGQPGAQYRRFSRLGGAGGGGGALSPAGAGPHAASSGGSFVSADSFASAIAARARRRAFTWVGLAGVAFVWALVSWFIFTYGALIYKLMGARTEASFVTSFGITFGVDSAKEVTSSSL